MADKLLLVTTFVVLTWPGLGLANRFPIWLTVCIISRDLVIVLTVVIVNLAIGRRTFRPSIFGKIATATYMVTAVVAMVFNYLGYHSVLFDVLVWASLAITLVSAFHYIWHAARIIEAPNRRQRYEERHGRAFRAATITVRRRTGRPERSISIVTVRAQTAAPQTGGRSRRPRARSSSISRQRPHRTRPRTS